ncbi:MAG: chromosomal replication initiator protein DnaA, partial [Lachnospiraceae bacterium]|nr:chromosomal replication initiator protein DnaA [Lachnospiraceae bacterium]
ISVVAEHFHFSPNDILSSKRDKAIAIPRQIAMYLSSEYTNSTTSKIGEIFGRDHSTVIHNVGKIADNRTKDIQLDETIKVLINKINPDI